MGDTAWKVFERFICRLFGGERDRSVPEECKNTRMWSPEAKRRKRITNWLEEMMLQAESQARDDQIPLVVLTEHRRERMQSLVIMRLQDVYDWWVGGPSEPPDEEESPAGDQPEPFEPS